MYNTYIQITLMKNARYDDDKNLNKTIRLHSTDCYS